MQGPPEQRRLHWTVLLLPAALAAFLGTWQVGRQKWKVEQVQQREAGLKVMLLLVICKTQWMQGLSPMMLKASLHDMQG